MLILYGFVILLQAGVATWLIYYPVSHDRGPKEPPSMVTAAGAFGLLAVVVGLIAETIIIPASATPDPDHPEVIIPAVTLLLATLAVGVIEEAAKAGPLAAFIYKKGYFNEFTDGIIYFGTAGVIFGLLEDIGYTLSFGAGVGIARIITGPFMHAGFSCMVGYALARHKLRRNSIWTVVAGFGIAAGLHMFYDFGIYYHRVWSIIASYVIAIAVNVGIFVIYKRAAREDVRRGLSTTGVNRFCRNCGYPNYGNTLFCTRCGKHT